MYRQCVPCHCNFSYNFKPVFFKFFECFLPGLQKCTWVGYDFIFIFVTFSTVTVIFLTSDCFPHCELSHFLPSIYRQWVPHEHNSSYNFIPIFLKLWTCFLHSLKICICFSYNPCLFLFVTFPTSTAKNEINLFNNHVLIVAPVTFSPAGATPPSAEFWFHIFNLDFFAWFRVCSGNLVSATPPTVLYQSF